MSIIGPSGFLSLWHGFWHCTSLDSQTYRHRKRCWDEVVGTRSGGIENPSTRTKRIGARDHIAVCRFRFYPTLRVRYVQALTIHSGWESSRLIYDSTPLDRGRKRRRSEKRKRQTTALIKDLHGKNAAFDPSRRIRETLLLLLQASSIVTSEWYVISSYQKYKHGGCQYYYH